MVHDWSLILWDSKPGEGVDYLGNGKVKKDGIQSQKYFLILNIVWWEKGKGKRWRWGIVYWECIIQGSKNIFKQRVNQR